MTLGLLSVKECNKGIDPCKQPPRPPQQLCLVPRQIFLGLQDVQPATVEALETFLREKHSIKTQKNAMKEFLEVPMLAYKKAGSTSDSSSNSGLFVGSSNGKSSSNSKQIENLPEKLVIQSKEFEQAMKKQELENADLNASALFGNSNGDL